MQKSYNTRAAAICMLAMLLTANTGCTGTPRVRGTEYEVLSAFIDAKFADKKDVKPLRPDGEGISRIVILNPTESDEEGGNQRLDGDARPIPWIQTARDLQSKVPTLTQTAIDAFREVNRRPASFQRSFHLAIDYEVIESSQLPSIFKNSSWPAYYKQFPGSTGILRFSRVGFSADGTQALFYASNRCGGLCGGGEYVVMDNYEGRWVIVKEIQMWIS